MATTFHTSDRYGGKDTYNSSADVDKIVKDLLQELRIEQDGLRDNEHTEVSIHQGDLAIAVNVSGRVTLLDETWLAQSSPRKALEATEDLYMRNVPDDELVEFMCYLARGESETVLAANWLTEAELPPHEFDFYRDLRESN